MSFMLTRGKIFICQKCGHRVQVEYEGGETMTQIGDFEVMRQTQIAEELCEQQTIESSKGFYLYDFGLCGTCYEKDIDKAMKEKSRELNRLFPKLDVLYGRAYQTLNEKFEQALGDVEAHISWDEISKVAGGYIKDSFDKPFQGKRDNPIRIFMRTYGESLEKLIINKIFTDNTFSTTLEAYKVHSKEILKKIIGLHKTDNKFYMVKKTDFTENLNEFIVTDTSVRIPIKNSISESFYYHVEMDCRELLKNYRIDKSDFFLPKGKSREILEKVLGKQI